MKVAVLGACGQIGNAIVRELIERGHEVSGVARSHAVPANLEDLDFVYCRGDIDDEDFLDNVVAGHTAVVDAAAPYSLNLLTATCEAERRPLDHASQRSERLTRSLLRHGTRLVYVSSSLTEPAAEPVSLASLQSRVVRKLYPYFRIKRLIEDRIADAVEEGMHATVVRPTTCIGPWDAKPRDLCWIPKLIEGEVPGTLRHKINVIDTRDLAVAIALLVDGTADGETITLAGHNSTTDELTARLCEAGGVPAPQWGMPAAFGIVPLIWAEAMWAAIGSASPLPSLVPALLCEQRWVEPDPIQRQLGLSLRPLAETARDTVAWYRSRGYC
jgi:dihydroflavonol-4-reductase